jgi:hypothetical protein
MLTDAGERSKGQTFTTSSVSVWNSDSHLQVVISKAGAFQPAEGSCVGYPDFTIREIPHYA